MTRQEIKSECDLQYEQIRKANDRLSELRKNCSHEHTFERNYSYRVGSITPAIICSDCGEVVKTIFNYLIT